MKKRPYRMKTRNRILAGLLSMLIILQSVPEFCLTALAQEEPGSQKSAEYVLQVNGSSAATANQMKIRYGQNITLSLAGLQDGESVEFYYASVEMVSEGEFGSIESGLCTLTPGFYYLRYSVTQESMVVESQTTDFAITVEKAALAAPGDLTWTGSQISWSAPTGTTDGYSAADLINTCEAIAGYELCVYKNGNKVFTTEVDNKTLSYQNIENNIVGDAGWGNGSYTFTVKAKATADSKNPYFAESPESGASAAYMVPRVTIEADDGFSSMEGTGTSHLLLPGNSNRNSVTVSFALKEHYSFQSWEAAGFNITKDEEKENTYLIAVQDAYSGGDTATVRASSLDCNSPSISNYSADKTGTLTATASDGERGIRYYAFSKEAQTNQVQDWTEAKEIVTEEQTFTQKVSEGGVYYFHVKDCDGNSTVSSNSISLTKVVYHGYYENSVSKELTEYVVTPESYALPSPVRNAWNFLGWYGDEACSDEQKVTQITQHSTESGYQLYAKWEKQSINSTEIAMENLEFTYDGKAHTFSVNPKNTGTITYQWYRKNPETSQYESISEATSNSYSVKDVADSGDYRVEITLDHGDASPTRISSNISVTVKPKDLYISTKATPASIYYGQTTEPVYSVEYSGFVEGESESDITTDSISCSYQVGGSAGSYTIRLGEGFSASNYTIIKQEGTFTVLAKAGTFSAQLKEPEAEYVYEKGTSYTPEVIVKDGEKVLTKDQDYTVNYESNGKAGTAKAIVTLKGNYEGTLEVTFTIQKATLQVGKIQVSDWLYNGSFGGNLSIENYPEDGAGKITYFFRKEGEEFFTTKEPVDVGTYEVKATIAEGSNYLGVSEIQSKEFSVSKRKIKVVANSKVYTYDGTSHSDSGYTVSGDGFAPKQGFAAVWTTGAVQNVEDGTVTNELHYTLTSVTNADNYTIEIEHGTLQVSAMNLTVPSGLGWSTISPGRASWVAVAKDDLTVEYKLQLFAYDGTAYEKIGDEITTADSYTDAFKEQILSHAQTAAENDKAYTYFFTIQTIPSGGTAKGNYGPSAVSAYKGPLCTAQVQVGLDQPGRGSVTINGSETNTVFFLQGQTARIIARVEAGYNYIRNSWQTTNKSGISLSTPVYSKQEDGSILLTTTLSVSAGAKNSLIGAKVELHTMDEVPEVVSYTASNAEDLSEVTLSFSLKDGRGLDSWMISDQATIPAVDDEGWNKLPENSKSYEGQKLVSKEGEYYLFVKDTFGNVATAADNAPLSVYKITLKPGDGAQGSDIVLYKAQNTTIILPANTFTKDNLAFQNWYGSTGIYQNKGSYGENANDTLTAHWTDEYYTYAVKYYYMDTLGSYPEEPQSSEVFSAVSGAVVTSALAEIQKEKTGFLLDTSEEKTSSIEVSENGKSLAVYYKRQTYQVIYKYTLPGAEEETIIKKPYLYGADLSQAYISSTKPSCTGYKFVGWSFGETGTQPSVMPAADVVATGKFLPGEAVYHIKYYLQDLESQNENQVTDSYTLREDLTQHINAAQGDTVLLTQQDLTTVDGFAFQGIHGTYGNEDGDVSEATETAEMIVKADENNQLTFHVYLKRKTYQMTLKVWQGEVGSTLKYSKEWQYYYGAALEADSLANYDKENWPKDSEYELASYVDWSTGSAPATMPAGDVTITRQFVLKVNGAYQVEVWTETDTEGTYSLHTFRYLNSVGSTVSVGNTDSDTLKYDDFGRNIDYFNYYQYRTVTDGDITSGAIRGEGLTSGTCVSGQVTHTNNGESPLVLRVFFERKEIETTIHYYYIDTDSSKKEVATVVKAMKWGNNHIYNCEPLAFFDSNSGGAFQETPKSVQISDTNLIDGKKADEYSFKDNYCLVSYSAGNHLNGTGHWSSKRFDTVVSLSENCTWTMGYSNNYVYVYYTKVDTAKHPYLDVVYDDSNLPNAQKTKVQLTYKLNDKTYKVRMRNEAAFYKNARYISDDVNEAYPGLSLYNMKQGEGKGTFVYSEDDGLIDGITKVTINDKTYYLEEQENEKYLYIPFPDNAFFYGNFTSYSFKDSDPGYASVTAFLENYKAQNLDNPYAQGASVYNHGWGRGIVTGNSTLTITFTPGTVYHLYYELAGTRCTQHSYAAGTKISAASVGCTHQTFQKLNGYEIVWYTNPECTDRISEDIVLNSSKTLYGQYEKSNIDCYEYAYYELADPVLKGETQYRYISESDLEVFGDDSLLTSWTDNDADTTTYYYDGSIVMIRKKHVTPSFANVEMNPNSYIQTGYLYDESNSNNNLKGYCQYLPISLRAYFACEKYKYTVYTNLPKENVLTVEYPYGKKITLNPPVREGYTFAGWSWTKGGVLWSEGAPEAEADGSIRFRMPNAEVSATASWTPAEYKQTISYYFQTNNEGTLGYSEANRESKEVELTQENSYPILNYDWYKLSGEAMPDYYILANVICRVDGQITQYNPADGKATTQEKWENQSFYAEAGMELEYYYELRSDYQIQAQAYEAKGDSVSMTIMGQGTHFYGQQVTLSAKVPVGYDFIGWYRTADVVGEEGLKSDFEQATKLCASAEYPITVGASADYVAIVKAQAVELPELSLLVEANSIDRLVYGYKQSTKNTITAKVTFPEDASSANYVKSYQWYRNEELIAGATGVTYLVPEGWYAGTYKMTCKIVVARSDNKQEQTVTAETQVVVKPAELEVEAAGFSGRYDAGTHSIQVKSEALLDGKTVTIYYSTTTPLTKDNYSTGSTTNPAFTNVQVDEKGNRGKYTVYYYLHTDSTNYLDCSGSQTVEILPIPLVLENGTAFYKKIYDGTEDVLGSISEEGTDLYKLVRNENIYKINGLLPADQGKGYILDCDAKFNSRHVSTANAVTLSHIKLADQDSHIVYNYSFDEEYEIILTGYINQRPLTLSWGETSMPYNGKPQSPSVSLERASIPEADRENLELVVEGAQTTKGSYTASASVVLKTPEADEEENGQVESEETVIDTEIGDFSLSNAKQTYKITGRAITVTPIADTISYNGYYDTLRTSSITKGSVIDGQTWTVDTDSSYKDAGQHTVTAKNLHIYDEETEADVTDNYEVTYGSNTLTIQKKKVTIKGITAENKKYDGKTTAVLSFANAELEGLVKDEKLDFEPSKIQGAFNNGSVGNGKTVSITYGDDVLIASAENGHEDDFKNYELDKENSQQSATADIQGLELTVTVDDKTVVYGDTVDFTLSYSGFLEGEDSSIIQTDTEKPVTFRVGAKEEEAVPYTTSINKGDYRIYADISGLSAENYSFKLVPGKLTVNARPVAVEAVPERTIQKVYDGNQSATVTASDYRFVSVLGETSSDLVNGETLTLQYTAQYNSANVGAGNYVKLTGLSIGDSNYELKTTDFTIPGTITPKALTIKAKDQSVIYGNTAAPEYSVIYSGFVAGESHGQGSDLTGTLEYSCEYDCNQMGKREVRNNGYEITPSGLTSTNYNITYEKGKLTVEKATLTFTAYATKTEEDSSVISTLDKDGDGNPAISRRYGVDSVPTFSYQYSGLVYDEEFNNVVTHLDGKGQELMAYTHILTAQEVTENEVTKSVISVVPGNYAVTPDPSKLSSTNYQFAVKTGAIRIDKYGLKVSEVTVYSKTYDGTTKVYDSQVDYDNVKFDGLLQIDMNYFATHQDEKKITVTGTYQSKDVAEGITVDLQIKPGKYLTSRCYVVDGSQKTTTATIVKRPVSITGTTTLQKNEIHYGDAVPQYDVVYGTVTGQEEKSGLVKNVPDVADETADRTNVDITCAYSGTLRSYSPVGDYTIVPSNFRNSDSTSVEVKNYEPSYNNGSLKVIQSQFPAPTPVWCSEEGKEGTVTWNAIANIGDVAVEKYEVKLYKNGVEVSESTRNVAANNTLSEDYKEAMRSAGAGAYTVKVTAVASTENNENKKNVKDSVAGESAEKYAASVSFVYEKGQEKQDGVSDASALTVSGQSSYVIIAGEKNIGIKANLVNATGYSVATVTSGSTALHVTSNKNGQDAFRSGAVYTNTVSMDSALSRADSVQITLKLKATPATLVGELTPRPGEDQAKETYGYSKGPELKMTVKKADTDNLTTSGYTYTYAWEAVKGMKNEKIGSKNESKHQNTDNNHISLWNFPSGQMANDNAAYYSVRCVVTATRSDNGESIALKQTWGTSASHVTNVTIERAPFQAEVFMEGWTYGETRKTPSLTNCNVTVEEHPTIASPSYEYTTKTAYDTNQQTAVWSATLPKDAGAYYVRATIAASTNYSELTTQPKEFTIGKAKLDTPNKLSMGVSGTASYGTISWGAVSGKKENNGVTSDSQVKVVYHVELFQKKSDGTWESKETYEGLSATSLDVLSEVKNGGTFKFSVQAIAKDDPEGRANCDNSEVATSSEIIVGASIFATENSDYITADGSFSQDTKTYSKKYNGKAVYLVAKYEGSETVTSYEWYQKSDKIAGATTNVYTVSKNAGTGEYTCVLTLNNGTKVYTPVLALSISKRSVIMTSASDYKTYDANALKNSAVTVTGDGFINGEGATYSVTGSQTDKGSSENAFTYTLKDGTDAGNYEIQTKYGKLTVDPLALTVTITGNSAQKLYNGNEQSVSGYIWSAKKADNSECSLYKNNDIKFTGTAEVKATNVKSDEDKKYSMDLNASQFGNTNANFTVTFLVQQDGWLEIKPIQDSITVKITGNATTNMYDGQAHTTKDYTFTATGTNSGLYKKAFIVMTGKAEASRTEYGTTQMNLSSQQFSNNSTNFTSVTFEIEKDGYQTITPVSDKVVVTIVGNKNTQVYDGTEHTVSGYEVTNISNTLYHESDISFIGDGGANPVAQAKRKDAGKTEMGLTAAQFSNTSGNFTNVTFQVTDGYQEITAKTGVKVVITGHNNSTTYDGQKHTVTGYEVQIQNDAGLYEETDFMFNGTAKAEQTDAGTSSMGLTATQFTNSNSNFSNVTFTVTDGYQEITPVSDEVVVTIVGKNDTKVYDGTEHTVSGYEVTTISNGLFTNSNISFRGIGEAGSAAQAKRKDIGKTEMGLTADQFSNSSGNFTNVTFQVTDGYQEITAKTGVEVVITGHNNSTTFDGQKHTVTGYDAQILNAGNLYTVSDFTFSGTAEAEQTDAGTTNMGLTATQFTNNNSNFSNVTFTVTDGYQTITPVSEHIVVTIVGKNDTKVYDGTEHTVSGYEVTGISNPLFSESNISFSGIGETNSAAEAKRTTVGKTEMGLKSEQFSNTSGNFTNVTFQVTDGYQEITAKTGVEVVITGHNNSTTYDGQKHTVTGYDVQILNAGNLYTVNDFTFSGIVEAERTDAGTTKMGLTAGQFRNTNNNFSGVTFTVTDGYQTITPLENVVVTIYGNQETVTYDGKEHTVQGYTITTSSNLYHKEDIVMTGEAAASRTNQGTTLMKLAASQFSNGNNNFKDVTFQIGRDGSMTINPVSAEVVVTIIGKHDSKIFDGLEHTVNGYTVTAISNTLFKETDISFAGTAQAKRTAIGKTDMGLTAEQFSNGNSNFTNVTFTVIDGYQAIVARDNVEVVITGKTDSTIYDGESHSVNGYDVEIRNSYGLYTESDFTFSGTATAEQTTSGTAYMGLTKEQFSNTNANFTNVTFTVTDGYQEITTKTGVEVIITGHNDSATYDGDSHEVTGYDVQILNADDLYTAGDFTFSGNDQAERKDAGTTFMGLSAEQFSNINSNFSDVTFTVTDGYQEITPLENVVVTIWGNQDKVTYDGEEHTVQGYTISATSSLYKQADIVMTGDAAASRTNQGTTLMNLEATQFSNGNNNFKDVTFLIGKDGSMAIDPITTEVMVTIVGNQDSIVYDGKEHTVRGYEVKSITNPLLIENQISFSGIGETKLPAQAKRTDAGRTEMGLKAEQFSNTSDNFTNVTFLVTDGCLTIEKKDVSIVVNQTSKVFGTEDPVFTGIVTGLVQDEDLGEIRYHRTNSEEAAGEYTDALDAEYTANSNYNVTVTKAAFLITGSPELTVEGKDYSGVYDGTNHGAAAITNLEEGTVITYSTDGGKTWDTAYPRIQNAGSLTVMVRAENPNYITVTDEYTLQVKPKELEYDTIELIAEKLWDDNTTARFYGKLNVTGMLEDEDAGFSYRSLSGLYADASAGEHAVEITVNGGKVANPNYVLPKSCQMMGRIVLGEDVPDQDFLPEDTEDLRHRLVVSKEISIVPDGLRESETLNSVEKIQGYMENYIDTEGYSVENTAFYEAEIQKSLDYGVTWTAAHGTEYQQQVIIVLPYPEGTNGEDYDFFVTHMFGENGNGHKVGDIEYPAFEKISEGLKIYLGGLSPISVSWVEAVKEADLTPESSVPVESESAITDIPLSPKTGDDYTPEWMYWIFAAYLWWLAEVQVIRKIRNKMGHKH